MCQNLTKMSSIKILVHEIIRMLILECCTTANIHNVCIHNLIYAYNFILVHFVSTHTYISHLIQVKGLNGPGYFHLMTTITENNHERCESFR